jgi:hypothetical protein
MKAIQDDLFSAEAFLVVLRPLLPDTHERRALAAWGYRYDPASRGATLFECFYRSAGRVTTFAPSVRLVTDM